MHQSRVDQFHSDHSNNVGKQQGNNACSRKDKVTHKSIYLVLNLCFVWRTERKKNLSNVPLCSYMITTAQRWRLTTVISIRLLTREGGEHKGRKSHTLTCCTTPYPFTFKIYISSILLTLDLLVSLVSFSTFSLLTIQHTVSPDKSG